MTLVTLQKVCQRHKLQGSEQNETVNPHCLCLILSFRTATVDDSYKRRHSLVYMLLLWEGQDWFQTIVSSLRISVPHLTLLLGHSAKQDQELRTPVAKSGVPEDHQSPVTHPCWLPPALLRTHKEQLDPRLSSSFCWEQAKETYFKYCCFIFQTPFNHREKLNSRS